MPDYATTCISNLRDAVVGSSVSVTHRHISGADTYTLHVVAKVTAQRVTLDDGTVWTRGGAGWGLSNNRGWRRHKWARLVLDLDAAKADMAKAREERDLRDLRVKTHQAVSMSFDLTREQCEAILAIIEEPK